MRHAASELPALIISTVSALYGLSATTPARGIDYFNFPTAIVNEKLVNFAS